MARKEPVNKALDARIRLRELAKYYCATASIPKQKPSLEYDTTSTQAEIDAIEKYRPEPAHLSVDNNLTALCQLAALRLDCARCFVSILDDRTQHVIAEATRSVSTFDETDHDEGDGLVLGIQSFPMGFGICSTTIGVFTGECDVDFGGADTIANEQYICVPDLLSEKKTRSVPAIQGTDLFRYYLEVPLRTDSGYVVGSICVIDPSVRKPTTRDIKIMQEMSKLVMQHLEMVRMKEDHRRAERLLDGLAHFIKGKESIPDSAKFSTQDGTEALKLSSISLVQSSYPNRPKDRSDSVTTIDTTWNSVDPSESSDAPTSSERNFAESAGQPFVKEKSSETQTTTKNADLVDDTTAPAAIKINRVFARAAKLLRQSMDLEACCFVEVPQNERFKTVEMRKNSCTPNHKSSFSSNSQSQESSGSDSEGSSNASTPEGTNKILNGSIPSASPALCHRLGFSTRGRHAPVSGVANNASLTISGLLLTELATRYPHGNIFHFDSVGSVSSSSDEQKLQSKSTKSARRHLASKLFKHFPNASSLVFLPLYDNDKQHVYAGYLGWTTDPERGLQKSELIYVAGFANSIMCEVMRLEAMATDKAKSDFISSISHELRSPLHGILAASQLLIECHPSAKQTEYLGMIDTCGRTLLDIMNHLLDHAKINHFTKQQKRGAHSTKMPGLDSHSLVRELNLLSLVEETAGSMFATSNQHVNSLNGATPIAGLKPVPIILNIAPHSHWNFNTEPGSWRRIIMNLIGNSIKYTQRGYIRLDLSFRHSHKPSGLLVELKFTDTGQGISQEYLKHRLYTPFAQENNLSVGAGLGLSLVQKIVSSLKGNIEIHSEIGSGTEVIVTIPLDESRLSSEQLSTTVDDDQIQSSARGQGVKFLGFEERLTIEEQPTGVLDARTAALIQTQQSLSSILVEWYGMELVTDNPRIIVIEETFFRNRLEMYDKPDNQLLVVGLDGRSNVTDKVLRANCVYLVPPIGPIRMSQALRDLLDESNRRFEQSSSPAVASLQRPSFLLPQKFASDTCDQTPEDSMPGFGRSDSRNTVVQHVIGASEPTNSPVETPKEAILLVDDNDINLRILTACISRLNLPKVSYITATNGQEALDLYIATTESGTKISVVFMDISMPIMDGFTSTREIRAFEKSKGVRQDSRSRIIALTGLASVEAINEIEAGGFDMYLRKPVNLKTVRDVLMDERPKSLAE